MQSIIIQQSGGPEALVAHSIDRPEISRPDQVLIQLKAASVNPIDTKIRSNLEHFPVQNPAILGCDGAGIVSGIGSEVTQFKPGDEVYYCQVGFGGRQGSYAEYALVDQTLVAIKPSSLSFIEAAAAPLVLITAWEALFDRYQTKKGDRLLIPAGAGGVGHVAIQLARWRGATVCSSVSSDEKAAFVEALGTERVVNYRRDDLIEAVNEWSGGNGVDMAFDTVGDSVFNQCMACVRSYGDLVTILQPPEDVDWWQARQRNLRISLEMMLAPVLLERADDQRHQSSILSQCAALFDRGELAITVGKTFPLSEAADAHRYLEQQHPIGKVVLTVE